MPFGSSTGHSVVAGNMCAPASTVTRPAAAARRAAAICDDALRRQAARRATSSRRLLLVDELARLDRDSSPTPTAALSITLDALRDVGDVLRRQTAHARPRRATGRSRRWAAARCHGRGMQLDGIEADADEQIALVEDRLLDRGVGEHAGEPRMIVGHDALGLVGDHRRDAPRGAERSDGGGIRRRRGAKADEQQRLARGGEKRLEPRPIIRRRQPLLEFDATASSTTSSSSAMPPRRPGSRRAPVRAGRASPSWRARHEHLQHTVGSQSCRTTS